MHSSEQILSAPPSACEETWLAKFDRIARRDPLRTALISGGQRMSYGELAVRSSQLACVLNSRGIGCGTYIGIGLGRGMDLLLALLGVLKSGAAYIPIDPAYPTERIEKMIRSASIGHILTTSAFAPAFQGHSLVLLDHVELISDDTKMDIGPSANEPIYAIFTSGSTGEPKAASVYHRGFANLLDWYVNELVLGADDCTLVISSPSFDLTQKNFFAPLISGGTLVLDAGEVYDISRITSIIREHAVTLINCTPSAFYPIVEAAAADSYRALATLRFAVLGGEPIAVERLRGWLTSPVCNAEVVNSYGPTECTDICAFHRIHRNNLDDHPFVPLGREIPNVQVSIRDESLLPMPDGEIGELCISGEGVGGGYLNDPQRTAAIFSNSLYRTGDLARRLPGGVLEFRGRADHQVKVNGFRIELGEIENALEQHPEVRQAIVIANSGRFVAHVQGSAPATHLREYLAAILPAHMIPSEFREVGSFPMTPNGKVDRRALADQMTGTAPALAATTAAAEADVLALWSEILGRPVTDPTANFFDLGGNSIHVAVVHMRLMKLTGREFPITVLFGLPTARSIADFISPPNRPSAMKSARDRAQLARAAFSQFRRPTPR